jgi:hypothetical protein
VHLRVAAIHPDHREVEQRHLLRREVGRRVATLDDTEWPSGVRVSGSVAGMRRVTHAVDAPPANRP